MRRPITLVRCPAGRQKKCFYQRHAGSGVPKELGEVMIEGLEESGAYLNIKDAAGLVALVQMGVLELHPWGALIDRPDRPDRVIFDFDPGDGVPFTRIADAALEVRRRLSDLGLMSFCKTTGGKGLHVVAPIERRYDWARVKGFARSLAEEMAQDAPELYLTKISKAARRGKILIDYLRNDATSTAVAPYATRARDGAPVSMPLDWSEVTSKLDPAAFSVRTVPGLMRERGRDAWQEMLTLRQRLPAV
jgi:bifunctional non-homologous end joining protein LigD